MSILQQIQTDCANVLSADPYFANVPVLVEYLQDLGSRIDQALGALGVCVTIAAPTANVLHPDLPGPYFDRVRIRARITENVVVNQNIACGGTGKGALEVAEYVCSILHHFRPQNLSETLVCDNPTLTFGRDRDRLECEVSLVTQGGLSYPVPTLDPPTLYPVGDTITIAAPTSALVPVPGAAVFYTTDSTLPGPRNGRLYVSPFPTPVAGTIIQALAILPGYLTSKPSIYLVP